MTRRAFIEYYSRTVPVVLNFVVELTNIYWYHQIKRTVVVVVKRIKLCYSGIPRIDMSHLNEKKRVLSKERNHTYLAEASILPHCTTAWNFDKYSTIITFWRETSTSFPGPFPWLGGAPPPSQGKGPGNEVGETSPRSLPPGNSNGSSQNIRLLRDCFFKHISPLQNVLTNQRQSSFSFWQVGLWMCGRDTGGFSCLNWSMLWFFRNTGFNWLIHAFIFF